MYSLRDFHLPQQTNSRSLGATITYVKHCSSGGGSQDSGFRMNTSEELRSSQESVLTETADDPALMDDIEEERGGGDRR